MRYFFTFFLLLILDTLVLGQNVTYDLNLTKKDSLYYLQDKKYTGEVISVYPNGQAKKKFETINGLATGICYNYFEDSTFDKSKFLDTSFVRILNQKIIKNNGDILRVKENILNKQNEIINYVEVTIGGSKKLEKLETKKLDNNLNKKLQKQWDSLTNLNNQKKILIEDLNLLLSQEQKFVNLKKTEESKPSYENKVRLEFEHINFVKNGKQNSYYKNGLPEEVCNYMVNKKDGLFELFEENGLKCREYYFKNGIKNGRWVLYYDNGKIKEEGFYKNNLIDSIYKTYDDKGKLKSEIYYRNGKKNGARETLSEEAKYYFENTEVIKQTLSDFEGNWINKTPDQIKNFVDIYKTTDSYSESVKEGIKDYFIEVGLQEHLAENLSNEFKKWIKDNPNISKHFSN
jgi:antitoxin component YwqK of YwqJK toxin-antitoxin module